ncbi:MAG: RNA polymerase sigma factor [Pseudomonadota bacterium]
MIERRQNFEREKAELDDLETSSSGAGDAASSPFDRLYRSYFGPLLRGLRSLYGDGPPDPADIAQEAFARLAARGRLDEIGDLEGFVWISARNLMITRTKSRVMRDTNRREVCTRIYGEESDTFDPERVLIASDELDRIMEVVAEMPKRRREIFLLNRVHGLTPKAAGERLGVSRSAAVKHIAKAMAQIEMELGDPEEERS